MLIFKRLTLMILGLSVVDANSGFYQKSVVTIGLAGMSVEFSECWLQLLSCHAMSEARPGPDHVR